MKPCYPLLKKIASNIHIIVTSLILISMITNLYATPRNLYPFKSPEDAATFKELITEVRCVVCQNQNLAESSAPMANDLRKKIYLMVLAKKSKNEIKNYLTQRYGQFILLRPMFNKTNFILWLFPSIGIIILFIILYYFTNKPVHS